MEGDYVETSDAEEREEIRAWSDIYWKEEWHGEFPSTCNWKANTMYDSVLSKPHTLSCKPTSSTLQSTDSPIASWSTPGSTRRSKSFVVTPVQSITDSRYGMWEDGSACGELTHDTPSLPSGTGLKDMSEIDIPNTSSSPVQSQSSNALHPCNRGAGPSHLSARHGSSLFTPGRERSKSNDLLNLFSSPLRSCSDLESQVDTETGGLTRRSIINTKEMYPASPFLQHSPPHLTSPFPAPNNALTAIVTDATRSTGSHTNSPQATCRDAINSNGLGVISDGPRYPLRRRGPNQLKPYTVEQFQYKQALIANPEAIVKFHSLTRGGRGRYSDVEIENIEGLQDQDNAEDGGIWEESRRKRAKVSHENRSNNPETGTISQALVQYPDILWDFPSTDEEEAKEFHALSKEARKMERKRRANERQGGKRSAIVSEPRLTNGYPAKETNRHFLSSQSHAGGLERLPSLQDISSTSPPMTRKRRCTTPVLTSHSQTFAGIVEECASLRTTASDMEELCIGDGYHDMDVDGSGPLTGDMYTHSPPEVLASGYPIDRKDMKALGRVMPKFMINRLMQVDDGARRPRRRRSLVDSDDAEATLLPGQMRVRQTEHPKQAGEIKGDSESSDNGCSSVAESSPEDIPLRSLSGLRTHRHRNEHIMEITDPSDDSEGNTSDGDGVDDEEIQLFLNQDHPQSSNGRHATVRGENLIDWMLAKTRTIGTSRTPSAQRQSLKGGRRKTKTISKYKFDIHSRSSKKLGPERQTILNFTHFSDRNSSPGGNGIRPSRTLLPFTSGGSLEDADHSRLDTNPHMLRDYDVSKKRVRRLKAMERRARTKLNGLYIFPPDDMHIVTGRRKTTMVTVNLEDDDFRAALAPPPQNRVGLSQPAAVERNTRNPQSHMQLYSDELPKYNRSGVSGVGHTIAHQIVNERFDARHDIHSDLDIPLFHSGLNFGPESFTGRGWLHDLVREISTPDVTLPVAFTFRGLELGPSAGVEKLCNSIKDLINQLFDLACDLPELDREQSEKNLGVVAHLLCKLLSWFLVTSGVENRSFVQDAVQNHILQSLSRLREMSNCDTSLDRSTLSICWLMVELSTRLGHSLLSKSPNPLKKSVSWLVHNLLEYGLRETMFSVRGDRALDGSTTPQYTAELWVCLFHLIDYFQNINTEQPHIHLFWVVVMESLQGGKLSNPSLESSEATWWAIFSFCALAQFSIHGMTTATLRLTACWEFVVSALKMIRLTADPALDGELSAPSLNKRDKYLGLITVRCFRLWDRWHWSLDSASILFNHLVDMFRSRKFANLRHEKADYPAFMLTRDWNLLSNYQHGDTAFILFLKLMYQAINSDKADPNRAISPRGKKLLSLAIPVGSLPFSRSRPTHVHDLSLLCNRLGAVAIGIYLDPSNHISRVMHARTYVNFSDADETTRLAVVRGMMNLGILLENCNVPLDAIADWIKEMADILVDEFKAIPQTITENHPDVKKTRLVMLVSALLCAVRQIVEAHAKASKYPEPALMASCSRILRNKALTDNNVTITREILRLGETFFSARAATIPAPARPLPAPAKVEQSQESQDEYGSIGLDFDDPAVCAALGDDVQSTATADYRTKEEALKKAIESTGLNWLCWRCLNKRVLDPPQALPTDNRFTEIESWLDCWLGCADVLIRHGGKSWEQFLQLINDSWGRSDDICRRRIDLALMLRILKLDPMTSTMYTDRYVEVMVEALVSSQSVVESEYISLLLSVDGPRHPLLKGMSCSLGADNQTSEAPLPELLPQVLQAFIDNVAHILREEAAGNPLHAEDNIKNLGYCIRMLSTMRSICAELDAEPDARRIYVRRCQGVLDVIDRYPEVRSHPRLNFLIGWGKSLR